MGPPTNNAQMAISVIPAGSLWIRNFTVDGPTNIDRTPIRLEGGKNEVKAGEPFSLLVRIRNLSTNETLHFADAGPYQDPILGLACVVISPSGKDVSPGLDHVLGSLNSLFLTAGPNETVQFEFQLSRLCKLEEIGTYTITATKGTNAHGKKALVITSNTLRVSVVPDK